MMAAMWLNDILSNAPHTKCLSYESGNIIVCKASGAAKNVFYLHCGAATVALETDGEVRFVLVYGMGCKEMVWQTICTAFRR